MDTHGDPDHQPLRHILLQEIAFYRRCGRTSRGVFACKDGPRSGSSR